MSDSQGGAGRREVAFRLFAAEYDDADFSYSESDEERAPNYVVTPTGARVNRLFVVGVLTEVEAVSDDYLRARVVDPTGPFVVYAGQYQPEAMNFLEHADPPLFVAVTGKARTFQPDDSDRVYTSIRPESINEVDAETRDRWVVQAAEQTIDRVARAAEAKHTDLAGDRLTAVLKAHGVDDGLASGIAQALDHYGTTGEYLAAVQELAVEAARVVAGERDEVAGLGRTPDDGTDDQLTSLVETPIDVDGFEPDDESLKPDVDETADASGAPNDETPDVAEAPEPDTEPSPSDEEIDDAVEAAAVGDESSETISETTETETAETETTAVESEESETAPASTETAPASTDTAPASTDTTAGDETVDESEGRSDEELEEFEGEFELGDDERAEIEEEYGTEFQSGSEVDDPGEADIETPTTEPPAEPDEADALDEATEDETDAEDETETGEIDEATAEEVDDVETGGELALDDAVMEAMTDIDDGDGADRDAVVGDVVEATSADADEVEDAIQEALMDGRCYEPDDGTLKAI